MAMGNVRTIGLRISAGTLGRRMLMTERGIVASDPHDAITVPTHAGASEASHSGGHVGKVSQAREDRSRDSSLEGSAVAAGETRGSASASGVAGAREDWQRLWVRPDSVWAILDREKAGERRADVHGLAQARGGARVSQPWDTDDPKRGGASLRIGGRA